MKNTAWILLCLFVLSGCASRALRPPEEECPGTPSLPLVCLEGEVVVSCYELGDVNGREEVKLGDLVILHQYVLGIKCPVNWVYGDMNGDEQLDAADILLHQKKLLGL